MISSRIKELTDATVEFGVIPKEHWNQPDWVDEKKATASRDDMVKNGVIYGGRPFSSSRISIRMLTWLVIGSVP